MHRYTRFSPVSHATICASRVKLSRVGLFSIALFSIGLLSIDLSPAGVSIKAADSEPPVASYTPVARAGGRVIEILPDESRSLAWIVQGTRVFAVEVSALAGLREIGSGLHLPEPITALAIDGLRGLAIDSASMAYWLDLSQASAPHIIRELPLGAQGSYFGPAVLFGNLAYVASAQNVTLIDLESGLPMLDRLIHSDDIRVLALTRIQDSLAISTGLLTDRRAPNRLRLYPLHPQPGMPRLGLDELGSLEDPAIRELQAARVDGEDRLYAFRDDDNTGYQVLALSVADPAHPRPLARWSQGISEGVDYSGMAVSTSGEVYLRGYRLDFPLGIASSMLRDRAPRLAQSPQFWINEYYVLRIATDPDVRSQRLLSTGRPYDSFPRLLNGHLLIGDANGLVAGDPNAELSAPYLQLPSAVHVNQLAFDDRGFLFASNDSGGLISFSLADPQKPKALDLVSARLRHTDLTAGSNRLAYTGYYAGVSMAFYDTTVVNIADPWDLQPTAALDPGTSTQAETLAQAGHRLVTGRARSSLVRLHDLSDPDRNLVLDTIDLERDSLLDIATDGRRVLVLHRGQANAANGLVSLLLSLYWIEGLGPKAHLRLRAVQRIANDHANDRTDSQLVLENGIAWITFTQGCSSASPRLLLGYDLGNPSTPRPASWLKLPDQSRSINAQFVADGHLFIPGSPVLVVDIRQPESPRLVARLIPGGPALAVHQGLAYVADDYSGIHIYRPDLAWAGDLSKPRPTPPRPTPQALPSPTFDCRPTDRPSATPTPPTPTPTTRPSTTPYAWPTRRPSPTPTATETGAGIATGRAFLPVMVREAR